MDDEYGTCTVDRPSQALRWQNIVAVVLSGAEGALDELSGILDGIACLLMADANHQDDRRSFHEEAAQELEMLLGGDDA